MSIRFLARCLLEEVPISCPGPPASTYLLHLAPDPNWSLVPSAPSFSYLGHGVHSLSLCPQASPCPSTPPQSQPVLEYLKTNFMTFPPTPSDPK